MARACQEFPHTCLSYDLYLISLCSAATGPAFGLLKSGLLGRRVCLFSRRHSNNARQTSKDSDSDVRGEVSCMTFTYLYHLLKSEPVGDGVIQEELRAFHTALKNICSEAVGGKAADMRHLLGKRFQHFRFSLTAHLLPHYNKNNSTQPT